MNEQLFRQLAEQAQIGLFEDKSFGWSVIAGTDQHLSKFAESIVREMLKTCEEHPGWYGRDIGKQIKQHFGVEE
jgi:hypothetical protein